MLFDEHGIMFQMPCFEMSLIETSTWATNLLSTAVPRSKNISNAVHVHEKCIMWRLGPRLKDTKQTGAGPVPAQRVR